MVACAGTSTHRDEQLADLYGGARAFAFLSEYEGLGTTPPRSAGGGRAAGRARHAEVARETYGDAALYVPIGDVGRTARALELALFDEPTRASILGAAPATL